MIKRLRHDQEDRYHRPHDCWIELPIQTVNEDGELTTVTVRRRSLHKKRQIFTISFTAFTIGCLMIVFSSPYRNQFMAPGPLSSNHGQILAGQGANRCAACHGAANGSLGSWISGILTSGRAQGLSQSELCLKCHDKTFAAETALNPHNVSPPTLSELTNKQAPARLDVGAVFPPPIHNHNIACSACHREHHGSHHELTAMTDQQCQVCHQNAFHGFATDHPEFVDYSQKRRSRIAFDHNSHSLKHFPSKHSEFNCRQCHVNDSFQNVKRLVPYEEACAKCHQDQILESGQDGLALIALPMLDTQAIEDANLDIGTWPMAATGDFDGPIPPVMRILLTADVQAAPVLERLGRGFEFADIDPTKVDDVKDAVELVWAIKRLLYDLSLEGPNAARKRLESVLKTDVSDQSMQQMMKELDEAVFQNAIKRWIPKLHVEVARNRFGPAQLTPGSEQNSMPELSLKKTQRNWWPSEDQLMLRIATDDDLLAPNPLSGLMSPLDPPTPAPMVPVVRIPDKPAVKQKPIKTAPNSDRSSGVLRLKNQHADPMSDPELLAVNPLQQVTDPAQGSGDVPADNPSTSPANVLVPPNPKPDLVSRPGPTAEQSASDKSNAADIEVQTVPIDRPPLVVRSGWFRNDNLFRIVYQPKGHADECVQSWMDLLAGVSNVDSRPATTELFTKTFGLTGIGQCRSCHTADRIPDGRFSLNWAPQYRDPSIRSFTKFSHGAHMIQPHLQDCSYCHALDPAASTYTSLQSVDASVPVSNFLPLLKSSCATCHQENLASTRCTLCHDYHIGTRHSGTGRR